MAQLRVASYGFLLYAIHDDDHCRTIGAPKVPSLAHECALFIPAPVIDSGGLPLEPDPKYDGFKLALKNCNVSFSGSSGDGAETSRFDLIPEFTSLCCGASLDPEWRACTMLNVAVALPDGELAAAADNYTNRYRWSWHDCAERRMVKQLTGLTVYETAWPDPRIRITARKGGGTEGEILLPDRDVTLAFRNVPIDDIPEERELEVDLAHISSTVALCRINGPLRFTLGERKDSRGDLPRPILPEAVKNFLDLGVERLRGRPHCGGRQMTED